MIYGAGTITDLQSGFKAYFENFLSDDEQLAYKTEQLTEKFNSLGLALPSSNLAFKDLLLNIDETTASGQELYGRIIIDINIIYNYIASKWFYKSRHRFKQSRLSDSV